LAALTPPLVEGYSATLKAMRCSRCQAENREGLRFCEDCGARLAATCPSCGAEVTPGKRFCGSCGTPVATAQPESRYASPQTYTPKHLAEQILTSKSALEGERKQVTVLFADLKGSMELLADRDPEEARKILDPVLEHMMEAVHRYEGTVNQVMGDGIMALFGAPLAHEDHAVRACYAALRMQDAVRRYSDELRRAQGVEVQIRVGLNSGEVVVRSVGSDLRMDYTAVGQTTHLAARMEQLATPGTVRLTGETLRLAEGYVEVRSLGPIPVKGLSDPIEIFELTAAGQARTRLQAAALRGLTRFVGRDAEVEHLRRVLGQAGAGHGQVAAIVGEAGVGKSRLTYEFTHSHRVQDWLILEASSVSYGKATSYLPVIDLLKGYFKIGDRDNHREMRDKVMGRVLGLDRALEPVLRPLLALLDVPVEDAAWQTLDAPQRRQRTLDAVKRLLLRESQVQPLLVVFEDLHWIDGETQALLDSVVDSLGSARLLLLVNYRPEYQHGWGSKTAYSQMRLDTLPAESASELLDALLGEDPGLAPLKQLLVKRGNPFFLEENVRTLVETRALAGERGRYRLTQPVQAIQVPPTVQVILAARIDRLAPDDKRLLQVASVIGKDVPFALLQAIVDLPESELRSLLTHLQAGEFLYESRLFPDLEYTFKHALTQEVAYGSLLQERRRLLHGLIVKAIEDRHLDRLGEQIELLAHHAFRGELWEKAVEYLRQAGARAIPRAAHREARTWFEQALVALQHLPETRERLELAIDLRFNLRSSLQPLGEHATILQRLRECASLAKSLCDQRRLGRALVSMVEGFWALGDYERALEAGERGLAIAKEIGDLRIESGATFYLGQVYQAIGDHRRALDSLRSSVASVEGHLRYEYRGAPILLSVISRTWLVVSLAELGEFSEGIAIAEDAFRIADAVGHPLNLVSAHLSLGVLHLYKGELEAATAALERSLGLVQDWSISGWFHHAASQLGFAHALAGHHDKALPLLEGAVQDAAARGRLGSHSLRLARLGEGYLLAGRVDDTIAFSQRALDLSLKHKERGHQAWALRLLGEVAAHREPPHGEDARDQYGQALVLANELSMRPLVAHCHLGLGKLYWRTGKREQAREHLTTATTMYREMDMRFWLEKAEAEVKELI
jgi:class 3 adenylate cyclase/tetratricopeptide (TPR) repeat protein